RRLLRQRLVQPVGGALRGRHGRLGSGRRGRTSGVGLGGIQLFGAVGTGGEVVGGSRTRVVVTVRSGVLGSALPALSVRACEVARWQVEGVVVGRGRRLRASGRSGTAQRRRVRFGHSRNAAAVSAEPRIATAVRVARGRQRLAVVRQPRARGVVLAPLLLLVGISVLRLSPVPIAAGLEPGTRLLLRLLLSAAWSVRRSPVFGHCP